MYRIVTYISLFILLSLGKEAHGQCNPVGLINVNSVTDSSAVINIFGNGPSPFQIQYGPIGFIVGTQPVLTITSNNYTITGLTGSSTYSVYVRDTCTNGQVSAWTGPILFTTPCTSAAQAPVFYNFDTPDWQISPVFTLAGSLAACWNITPNDSDYSWTVGPQLITSFQTGPNADHTTGLGKYLHVGNFGLSPQLETTLQLPKINLSGLSDPELSFWYHMYGAGIDKLVVLAKSINSTTWDTLQTINGQQQSSKSAPWLKSVTSLLPYLNATIEIRFVGIRTSTGPFVEMAIDDLGIQDYQTCPDPRDFEARSVNNNSALLTWTSDSAMHWQLEYGLQGFVPGTGAKISSSSNPLRINGLASNTKYDFYLQDSCSANELSNWIGPLTVETDCNPIAAPYQQDFEDSTWQRPVSFSSTGTLNTCWNRQTETNYFWDVGPGFTNNNFTGPSGDHTTGSGQYLYTNRNVNWGLEFAMVTTPLIDLSNVNVPQVIFWYHMYGGTIDGLDVAVDSGDGFHNILVLNGQQQVIGTSPWKEAIISLPDYAGKVVKIQFKGRAAFLLSNLCHIAIDDFLIRETPPCPKPINIEADKIRHTTAEISWLTGGASNWLIKVKPSGGVSTINAASQNPYLLSGLTPNTSYEIWVKDSCGLSNTSVWNGPVEFRTMCLPQPTPYFENFDGPDWIRPTGFFTTGEVNTCWRRAHDEGFYWDAGPPFVVTTITGALNDHTTGGGKYLVSDVVNFVSRDTAEILSPQIDLSTLAHPEMSFWYHMYGSSIISLQIEIDTGNGWMLLDTINGQQQSSKTQPWLERTIDLINYHSDTIQLKFLSIRTAFYNANEINIDDLSIHEKPLCTKPSNVSVNQVRFTDAKLSWIGGGAANWLIKYRPVGSGAFSFAQASSSSNFALTGLIPGTLYEFWVTDSCGNGNIGLWVGPKLFKTLCAPTLAPYSESFDGLVWQTASLPATNGIGTIDPCWSLTDTAYLSWMPYSGNATSTLSGPLGPRSGTGNYMLFNTIQPAIPFTTAELISPPVVITGLTLPELNFWYHMFGSQIGNLEIFAQKPDGSRTKINTIAGQQQFTKPSPWLQKTISLTNFSGDTIQIVFKGEKSGAFTYATHIAIDDVEIVDGFCHVPTNLMVTSSQPNSATLSWQSSSARSNLEYGLAGFFPGQGTKISNVTSPFTITGLQASTDYDFYVMDSCRASNSSWAGPYTFTTFCDTPTASFIYNNLVSFIAFDASSSAGPISLYDWDFGDGSTGTGISPSHTYTISGSYTVRLVVTDVCGLTDTIYDNLSVCAPPQAIINTSPVSPLIVSFDATQSIGAVSYWWDFGVIGTTNLPQPTIVFPAKASYPVYLIVTDSCQGTDTAFLEVNLCDKPVAHFNYNILSSGSTGMTVQFDGSLSQNAVTYEWDFGDGNGNNTSLNPTHTYNVASLSYQVTLITYADCGLSDTLSYKLQDVVSVPENDDSRIRIYPNPTKDKLYVEIPQERNTDFTWNDIAGRTLSVPIISREPNRVVFDVSGLASGSYTLIANINGQQNVVKVIIQ